MRIGRTGTLWAAILAALATSHGATWHVATARPNAADTNPGTADQPFKTISAALAKAQPGDTVEVGGGTYREPVLWENAAAKDDATRLTLTAAPGERPVVTGSDVVPGPWEPTPLTLRDGRQVTVYACPWPQFAEMLFLDGEPLKQIGLQGNPDRFERGGAWKYRVEWDGKDASDLRPGSFIYEVEGKRLLVWPADGASPEGHLVEAPVRWTGITIRGTCTIRGFDVTQTMDGLEQGHHGLVADGDRSVIEDCRVTWCTMFGVTIHGDDTVLRNCEMAHNALCGMTSSVGRRVLVEGCEFHDNAWRGDAQCGHNGNKVVLWKDSRFLRNHFHDEPASGLWMDINVQNVLVAENLFERCNVGVYFEISRWAVIANNVFRDCGRAVWAYGSDCLVAHNVIDGCGEGITISGYPREGVYTERHTEPNRSCLISVRNVLAVDNIVVDCPGSYVGITEDTAFAWNNHSDYNAFVWTFAPYSWTSNHLKFMSGWDTYYGKPVIWRTKRHCDEHSVFADRRLRARLLAGGEYIGLRAEDLVDEAGFVDRANGDYHLRPDSPLRGRGVTVPDELAPVYEPGSHAWCLTHRTDAPEAEAAPVVYTSSGLEQYRLQPNPPTMRLFDLDHAAPGTPGLNQAWIDSGHYPHYTIGELPEVPDDAWQVFPDNRLADPSFDQPLLAADAAGPGWVKDPGTCHTFAGVLAVNILTGDQGEHRVQQRVGVVRPATEYVFKVDLRVGPSAAGTITTGSAWLAVGPDLRPLGEVLGAQAGPDGTVDWQAYVTRLKTGAAGQDPAVGQELYVVLSARAEAKGEQPTGGPAAFVRWDDVMLLTSQPPG